MLSVLHGVASFMWQRISFLGIFDFIQHGLLKFLAILFHGSRRAIVVSARDLINSPFSSSVDSDQGILTTCVSAYRTGSCWPLVSRRLCFVVTFAALLNQDTIIVAHENSPRQITKPYRTLRFSDNPVTAVAFSPNGRLLFAGDSKGNISVWNVAMGEKLDDLEPAFPNLVSDIRFAPDGKQVALAHNGAGILLWDIKHSRTHRLLNGHNKTTLWCLRYSEEGDRIISGGGGTRIRIWSAKSGALVRELHHGDQLNGDVRSLVLSPDARRIYTAGVNGAILIWDAQLDRGQNKLGHLEFNPSLIALSPDGKELAFCGHDNTHAIIVYDLNNLKVSREFVGHERRIVDLTYAAHNNRFVSASEDGTVRTWSTDSEVALRVFSGYNSEPRSVAVNNQQYVIAAGYYDGIIALWRDTQ